MITFLFIFTKAPRFFCIDSVSDTKEFVDHVHKLYPKAPKLAIGLYFLLFYFVYVHGN